MCVFEIGAKPSELDVDLIVTKFCAYTSNLFGALIPMRSVVQGVPRRKSELRAAALCDAEVDPGELVVVDAEVLRRGQDVGVLTAVFTAVLTPAFGGFDPM